MLKKYDCWEDVKERFGADMVFECEGEKFLMVDVHSFRFVANTYEFVTVNNVQYPNGVIITYVHDHICTQYTYRKVDFV